MRKKDILLRSVLCLVLLCLTSSTAQDKTPKAAAPDNAPKYKNSNLPIDDRVADLLSRMALEEKIAQIKPADNNRVHTIDPTGACTDESASKLLNSWYDPDLVFPARKAAILRNSVHRRKRSVCRFCDISCHNSGSPEHAARISYMCWRAGEQNMNRIQARARPV